MPSPIRIRDPSRTLAVSLGVVLALSAVPAAARDWVVDSTSDRADIGAGDDVCDDGTGACTLRAAMQESSGNRESDRILFALPGPGPHVIALTDTLPEVVDSHQGLLIDGTSQPGYAGAPLIELDGSAVAAHALHTGSGHFELVAVAIHSAGTHGVVIAGSHFSVLRRCWVGLDAAGDPRGNGSHGVFIDDAYQNTIGSPLAGEENIIAANLGDGIRVAGIQNVVVGNLIGTDGSRALGNDGAGVRVDGGSNDIGDAFAGNVIASNGVAGVWFSATAADNKMRNNLVGTDAAGVVALANAAAVIVEGDDNTVGPGNVLSGNAIDGVHLVAGASGNAVVGNAIGVAADGSPLGNGGAGVLIVGGASDNRVGGGLFEDGNRIAHNQGAGVVVVSGSRNRIGFNTLTDNGGLGIDLGGDGVPDPNDPLDPDAGANDLLNAPRLTAASSDCTTVDVQTTLDSLADETFEIAWYAGVACDPSGYGEGARPIGIATAISDAAGHLDLVVSLPVLASGGVYLTATATDALGNTSEFSPCLSLAGPACPPGCGDGVVDPGEACDSSGFATADCDPDCTLAECGDGLHNPAAGEECDDNNTRSGDGCSALCAIETCIVDDLVAVAGLTVVRDAVGDAVFRWSASPSAGQYHVNRVLTKQELLAPWRAPRGSGRLRCFATVTRTECTEPPNPDALAYYQVLAACGPTGDLEGPP